MIIPSSEKSVTKDMKWDNKSLKWKADEIELQRHSYTHCADPFLVIFINN